MHRHRIYAPAAVALVLAAGVVALATSPAPGAPGKPRFLPDAPTLDVRRAVEPHPGKAASISAARSYNYVADCVAALRGNLGSRNTDDDIHNHGIQHIPRRFDWGRVRTFPGGAVDYDRYDRYRVIVWTQFGYGTQGYDEQIVELYPGYCFVDVNNRYRDSIPPVAPPPGW